MAYPQKQRQDETNTTFKFRKLQVTLSLYNDVFSNGSNSLTITDLAIKANIQKLPYPDCGKATVEIIGMRLEDMEKLSTLAFRPWFISRNYINIFAGDNQTGLTEIFAGTIVQATCDFNRTPDVCFRIEGEIGFWGRVTATGPTAIRGEQPASDFIKGQVLKAGFTTFENNGVNANIKNCVFNGSPIHQAQQCAKQIGAELIFDDNTAILMQSGSTRKGNAVLLNANTGLIGYPTITQNGVECKAIFNPDFKFAGLIQLETVVPKASGTWRIIKLAHNLTANDPNGGAWESYITGFYPSMSGACGRYV